MAKFCGKCGSRLDEATGFCPNCDAEKIKELVEKPTEHPKEIEKKPETSQAKDVPLSKKEARAKRKADSSGSLNIVGEWIFYENRDYDYEIYKMSFDGSYNQPIY